MVRQLTESGLTVILTADGVGRVSLSSVPIFSLLKLSRRGTDVSLPYAYNPSRRLALFHLSSAIPQSQLFGVKETTLLQAEGNTIETTTAANRTPPATAVTEENLLDWVKNDKRRMLHVVYRVGDLDKTIKFYTECLGMKLLRQRDIPEKKNTLMPFLDMDLKILILLLNLLTIMELTSMILEQVLDTLVLQLRTKIWSIVCINTFHNIRSYILCSVWSSCFGGVVILAIHKHELNEKLPLLFMVLHIPKLDGSMIS